MYQGVPSKPRLVKGSFLGSKNTAKPKSAKHTQHSPTSQISHAIDTCTCGHDFNSLQNFSSIYLLSQPHAMHMRQQWNREEALQDCSSCAYNYRLILCMAWIPALSADAKEEWPKAQMRINLEKDLVHGKEARTTGHAGGE